MNMHYYGRHVIATNYNPPPIPYPNMDWVAYLDDRGADDSPYGYGATEREAINELIEILESGF